VNIIGIPNFYKNKKFIFLNYIYFIVISLRLVPTVLLWGWLSLLWLGETQHWTDCLLRGLRGEERVIYLWTSELECRQHTFIIWLYPIIDQILFILMIILEH
jgi:hypothetical protein